MLDAQLCPTLCDPMDCNLPGSSVHGIPQARILEWVAMPSSRGSSQPRDQTLVSYVPCLGNQVLYQGKGVFTLAVGLALPGKSHPHVGTFLTEAESECQCPFSNLSLMSALDSSGCSQGISPVFHLLESSLCRSPSRTHCQLHF